MRKPIVAFVAGLLALVTIAATVGPYGVIFNIPLDGDATHVVLGNGGVGPVPGGGGGGGATMVGTVSNAVASAGLLSVDATKTNGIAATLAHITNAAGWTGDTTKFINGAGVPATVSAGFTNIMASTIAFNATLAPTMAISSLTTLAPRRVTFRCTLTGNVTTVSAPAGTLVDTDTMVWEMIQDGTGSRTITGWDTAYAFGTDITGITLTTTASKRDFITWIYNSTTTKWYCAGFVRGY